VLLDSKATAANAIKRHQAAAEECGCKLQVLRTDNGGEFTASALDGKMPYEAWHGHKLEVNYLRVFGCLAFVKELNHVGKLDDHSSSGVFIDYAEGAKAYRMLDPTTQRVRVARDVMFDEGRGWAWDKAVDDGSAAALRNFTIEYAWAGGAKGAQGASSSTTGSSSPAPTSSSAP
jgi:hypothetical protein